MLKISIKKILFLIAIVIFLNINITQALTIDTKGSVIDPGACTASKSVKFTASLSDIRAHAEANSTTISGACSGSGSTSASCGLTSQSNGGTFKVSSKGVSTGRTYMASNIFTDTANGSADATTYNIDRFGPTACGSPTISGTLENGYARTGTVITATWSGSNMTDPGCSTGRTVTGSSDTKTKLTATSYDNLNNPGVECSYSFSGRDDSVDSCTAYSANTSCTKNDVTLKATGSDSKAGGWYYIPETAKENRTYEVVCKDALGNSRPSYISVDNIDKEAPTCGSSSYSKPSNGQCTRSNVRFSFGCNDTAGGGRCAGCTETSYSAITSGRSGSLTIYDKVGNTNTCSISNDQWDGTAPTVTISYGNHDYIDSDNYTSDASVTVYLRATDTGNCNGGSGAGVDRICYKVEGATSISTNCVSGNNHSFTITNEGISTITAWAFDKSTGTPGGTDDFSYNNTASTNGNTNGGNKSSDSVRSVYIDRTKPDLTLTTSYDGKWTNKPIVTNISTADRAYSDGSHSGVRDIEYYFSISSNPSDIWGAENKNRPASGNKVPVNAYGVATPVGTKASNGTDSAGKGTYTGSISTPQGDKTLSDMIYIHVRSCDRAMTTNSTPAPNCTTKVLGPYYYDEKTDDLIITANNNSHNWTNQLVLTFTVTEKAVSSPMSSAGDRKTSGIDRMELYYDVDYVHEQDALSNAIYPSSFDNNKLNCSSSSDHLMGSGSNSKTCTYTIDFNDLRNDPDTGTSKVMEEGNRFIKVRVYDVAQNYTEKSFGPYRFDITKNKLSNIKFSGQEGLFVES